MNHTTNLEDIKLGKFIIRSGKAHISDPCYDRDTWCAGTVENVKNGEWVASVIRSDEGEWGIRNALLIAHHVEDNGSYTSYKWKKEEFEVGVDSGQAGIYDDTEFHGDDGGEYGSGGWYDINCKLTYNPADPNDVGAGVLPDETGVVSSSGYGDGGYECYTIRDEKSNEATAIMIDFGLLNQDEDEDEEVELCEACGAEEEHMDGLCLSCFRNKDA